ncbi:MAG: YegP family protein [Candidatus Methanoplasma sp.]|jgi:uncharacterized protein YegP (UPF0339 family)|nr:YegP family protein [Candidatus Methanoplasma sp.]
MGKFVVKPSKNGIVFILLAENGRVICTSQAYASVSSCVNGAESVKNNCKSRTEDQTVDGYIMLTHPKYEIFMDKGGKYRFRLKAMNGEIIASSQGYMSKGSCKKGIASVSKNAAEAPITKRGDL